MTNPEAVADVQVRISGPVAVRIRQIKNDQQRAKGRVITFAEVIEMLLAEHERARTEDMP
jgi:hypothetical protein